MSYCTRDCLVAARYGFCSHKMCQALPGWFMSVAVAAVVLIGGWCHCGRASSQRRSSGRPPPHAASVMPGIFLRQYLCVKALVLFMFWLRRRVLRSRYVAHPNFFMLACCSMHFVCSRLLDHPPYPVARSLACIIYSVFRIQR